MGFLMRIVLRGIITGIILGLLIFGQYDLLQQFLITFSLISIDITIEGRNRQNQGVKN